MKQFKLKALLATLTLGVGLLVGCGSKDEPTKASSSDSEQQEFVYAMSGIYKPFNYKENGKLVGFDVELGEALAEKMGMKPVPMTFPFESIIQGLLDDKFDAILGSMTVTEDRLKVVSFTDTYYRSGSQLFVAENNNEIQSGADAKDKIIGAVPATNYESDALKLTAKENVITYPQGDVAALMDIKTGRLDAVVADNIFAQLAIDEAKIPVKAVGDLLAVNEQAIAVNKDNEELKEKLNKALAQLIEDGTYAKISEKWFGFNLMDEKVNK
ncbi:transporter substrate-binding domain-containing protein [Lysinibacillus sp. 38-6]|uniref:transporter substrate-binding domain-containing protein n=1 Tax=Lysinibacillus sp. 38-6 TaxID=3385991 RepID=UPI003908BC1C